MEILLRYCPPFFDLAQQKENEIDFCSMTKVDVSWMNRRRLNSFRSHFIALLRGLGFQQHIFVLNETKFYWTLSDSLSI